MRRESTELGCEAGARYVVCPTPGGTVSTAEVLEAVLAAAASAGATRVYLAHAGQGAPDVAGEPAILLDALRGRGLDAKTASTVEAMAAAVAPEETLLPFDVSLVEQEICATAHAFSPSARSTWSATVSLDRDARHKRNMKPLDVPSKRNRRRKKQKAPT